MQLIKQENKENSPLAVNILEKTRLFAQKQKFSIKIKKDTAVEITDQNIGEVLFRMAAIQGAHQLTLSNQMHKLFKDSGTMKIRVFNILEKTRPLTQKQKISIKVKKDTAVEIIDQNTGEVLFRTTAIQGTHKLTLSNQMHKLFSATESTKRPAANLIFRLS
jgi:hypothetical protein